MVMKTTLEIPDSLHRRAKIRAAELGISFAALVKEALTAALERRTASDRRYRFAPPSARLGLKVDVSSRKAYMDRL